MIVLEEQIAYNTIPDFTDDMYEAVSYRRNMFGKADNVSIPAAAVTLCSFTYLLANTPNY